MSAGGEGLRQLNLQEVAARLGVHYQTVYRWVRDSSLAATKHPTSGYDVLEDDLTRFAAARTTGTAPPRLQVRDWDHQIERLLGAFIVGDEHSARTIVERLTEGSVSVLEVCERLLVPCMAEIGERWHRGSVSIAVEHRATAICERLLARISTHPSGRPRGTAVITTLSGDLHAMPSTMAALVLREDRWRIHHLGANVPHVDVVELVEDVDADLVVISMTNSDSEANAEQLLRQLTANGRRILVGRPGDTLSSLVELARS